MVNRVTLLGNLGKDPELKFLESGQAVAKFPLATSRTWKNKDGEKQEATEWHNIVVFGKQGENCAQYLTKGRQAYVEGEIRTRSYEKDGEKKFFTEIVANSVQFIGGAGGSQNAETDDPGF